MFSSGRLPAWLGHPGDWQRFWAGGATVGTPALFNEAAAPRVSSSAPHRHGNMDVSAGYCLGLSSSRASVDRGRLRAELRFDAGPMLALSGWMLAGVFGFERWFGIIAALAWQPAIYAGDLGQISALWLFFISLAMTGAASGSSLILGTAIGLLLLKPTIGLPFLRSARRPQAVEGVRNRGDLCGRLVFGKRGCDRRRVDVDTALRFRRSQPQRR